MAAKITSKNQKYITIEVKVPISTSMLCTEWEIQKAVNQVGNISTEYALSAFDTDGNPIVKGNRKYTSKGKVAKHYQTPYGEVELERHVYQSTAGGATYCPLDKSAKIIVGSTPLFSKQVSSKYSETGSSRVQKDLKENHGRTISRNFICDISEAVGRAIEEKEELWSYAAPIGAEEVATIGVSLDGTCMYLSGDGYREAMVGTISLYNVSGERLYTHYTANSPEYGKNNFYTKFRREINRFKKYYPRTQLLGIADGAKDNWTFLSEFTDIHILDYFHASEYVASASKIIHRYKQERAEWTKQMCHSLKHEKGGAKKVLKEISDRRPKKMTDKNEKKYNSVITYFKNHMHQMDYCKHIKNKHPIGSGVVEAACKVIIKQRLCNSGMKWKVNGANTTLTLRCHNYSGSKWGQTWDKISRYGI